ncbi:MAG: DUF2889 domain-containing protein [Burkholderiales bacterium]
MTIPLSLPKVPRERLHCRAITYDGFRRDDGLFDIEAHLIDVKDHDTTLLSGVRPAGVPVHDMWVRVTIDRDFFIRGVEAFTDSMPYPGACDRITPAYGKLVGANLVSGFRKRLHDLMGGVHGCTHITELLSNLPTAAVQTFAGLQREDETEGKPFQLDRCHALETTTELVRRYYPKWYHGAAKAASSRENT